LKLSRSHLKRLESFLAARHAGLTSATEVAATLSWLLDRSIQQAEPSLALHEREAMVRALLLGGSRHDRN
jgi:hypothetical protein